MLALGAAGKPFYPVRLMGGSSPALGRLEVFANNTWAHVPYALRINMSAALWDWMVSTTCRELGFQGGAAFGGNYFYSAAMGPQWGMVRCQGNESSIAQCSWGALQNSMLPATGIMCSNTSGKLPSEPRLDHASKCLPVMKPLAGSGFAQC